MADNKITIELGRVPKERGLYVSGAKYYKDNIVEYRGAAYIADPINFDSVTNPNAYVTVAPWTTDRDTLNTGWRVFADGNPGYVEEVAEENIRLVNEALAAYTPVVVLGDVTNVPDEEDITSTNVGGTDVLKFKDKAYAPAAYSGMGRVYLRKNMVNGVNTLTQDMLYKGEVGSRVPNTNTIFVIQYDYDLNNAEITIPENCVLKFDGGSLSNGTIIGNQTTIVNNGNKPALNVSISGDPQGFINDLIPVDWFIGNSDSDKIQAAIDFAKVNQNGIKFLNRTYYLDKTVIVDVQSLTMIGANNGGEYGRTGTRITVADTFSSDYTDEPMFYFCGSDSRDGSTLGTMSFRIEGIQFLNAPNNDVFHMRFTGAPARPFYITYCLFSGVRKAIKICNNNTSTNVGWLTIQKSTFANNSWCLFAEGYHSIMNLDFRDNVAEQCQGCINIGFTDVHSETDAQEYVPQLSAASATCLISIENNLLEGTVDAIYIYGGSCIYKIIGNYFERGTVGYKQFVVLNATSLTTAYVLDNHNASIELKCLAQIRLISNINYHNESISDYGLDNVKVPVLGSLTNIASLERDGITDTGVTIIRGSSSGERNYNIFDGVNRYKAITKDSQQSNVIAYSGIIPANSVVFISFNYKYQINKGSGFLYRYRKTSNNLYSSYRPFGAKFLSNPISTDILLKIEIPEEIDILDIRIASLPTGTDVYYISLPTMFYVPNTSLMDVLYYGVKYGRSDWASSVDTLPTSAPEGSSILVKSIGKHVYFKEGAWVEDDGAPAGILRRGDFADKPELKDTYTGFKYFSYDTGEGTTLTVHQKDIESHNIPGNGGVKFINNNFSDKQYKFVIDGRVYSQRVDTNTRAKMMFVKSQDSEEDGILVEFKNVGERYKYSITQGPDSTEYPYLKCTNVIAGTRTFKVIDLTNKWVEEDGAAAGIARNGTTTNRPVGSSIYVGFMYMDTTLGKPIYANAISGDTVTWVDSLGNPVDTVYPKVIGTTTTGNLAKFNSTNIEDAGVAPQI